MMRRTAKWAAVMLLTATLLPEVANAKMPAGPVPVTQEDITRHIRSVLSKMKRDERWERAPKLARMILEEANRYQIDPLVLTVIVQTESTFQEGDLRGKVGEVGLTQIWGAAKHCDRTANLRTSRGQIRAGACWYAYALEKCKTELSAFHAYQSGQCKSNAYGPLHRSRILYRARSRIWHRQKEIEDLLNPSNEPLPKDGPAYADALDPALSVKEQLTL